jgi:co-chaperonin GroES (HSP10)
MEKGIRPVGAKLLVREVQVNAEAQTKGGLFIPIRRTDQDLARGDVLYAPELIYLSKGGTRPCVCKTGDRICYPKHSGMDVEVGGEAFVILDESEVMGIVERELGEGGEPCERGDGEGWNV